MFWQQRLVRSCLINEVLFDCEWSIKMNGFAIKHKDQYVNWQGLLVDDPQHALVVKTEPEAEPFLCIHVDSKTAPVEVNEKNFATKQGTYYEWHAVVG
jgi:hypothetical protein